MTIEEKRAMKAACVQAAATLIAARESGKGQIDVEECIKLAHYSMSALLRPIGGSPRNRLCQTNGGCTTFARATVKAAKAAPLPTNIGAMNESVPPDPVDLPGRRGMAAVA
jgi:hypothetical protein